MDLILDAKRHLFGVYFFVKSSRFEYYDFILVNYFIGNKNYFFVLNVALILCRT